MNWITESNRQKHFLYAIPCAFLLTILFVGGLACGMEFKDRANGGKWDLVGLVSHHIRRRFGANAPNIADLCLKVCFLDTFLLPLQCRFTK